MRIRKTVSAVISAVFMLSLVGTMSTVTAYAGSGIGENRFIPDSSRYEMVYFTAE